MKGTFIWNGDGLKAIGTVKSRRIKVPDNYLSTMRPNDGTENGRLIQVYYTDRFTGRMCHLPIIYTNGISHAEIIRLIRLETDPAYVSRLTQPELDELLTGTFIRPSYGLRLRLLSGPQQPAKPIDEGVLKAALDEEERIRRSPEFIDKLAATERTQYGWDWIDDVGDMQTALAKRWYKKAGVSKEEFLHALRCQPVHDPPDGRSYNRAQRGFIHLGMPIKSIYDVKLCSLSMNMHSLSQILSAYPINIIVASSVS